MECGRPPTELTSAVALITRLIARTSYTHSSSSTTNSVGAEAQAHSTSNTSTTQQFLKHCFTGTQYLATSDTPVVSTFGTGNFMRPGNRAVTKANFFQMREMTITWILAIRHDGLHINNHRTFYFLGEIMLGYAFRRGAIPFNSTGQALTRDQRLIKQRR
jgi:hypothetical protein